MIHFDAQCFSKYTYARFRSSLALERFISAPGAAGRERSLKWARAWLLVVPRNVGQEPPTRPTSSIQATGGTLDVRTGQVVSDEKDAKRAAPSCQQLTCIGRRLALRTSI